jgi:ATP-binding cassette subfamily F protein 3
VADRLWLVAEGRCEPYNDDLEAYRNLIVAQRRKEREALKQESRSQKQREEKSSGGPSAEKQAEALEQKLAELTARKDAMENEMAVCSTNGDAKQLKRLNESYAALNRDVDAAQRELEALIATL